MAVMADTVAVATQYMTDAVDTDMAVDIETASL